MNQNYGSSSPLLRKYQLNTDGMFMGQSLTPFRSLVFLLKFVLGLAVFGGSLTQGMQWDSYFDLDHLPEASFDHQTQRLNNGLLPIPEGKPSSIRDHADTFTIASPSWIDFFEAPINGWEKIKMDHRCFYSRSNAREVVLGLGVGAILAHSGMDERFRRWQHGDSLVGSANDFSGFAKQFGEGKYVLPTLVGGYLIGMLPINSPGYFDLEVVGRWGERGVRGAIIGLPALAFGQLLVGASRPEENRGSKWRPFQDDNGVSGHSFMGALPFLTAANMTDNPLMKSGLFFCSALPAWSRLQDDAHYLSQAVLGWGLAFVVCRSVDQADRKLGNWQLHPIVVEHGAGGDLGLGVTMEY